MLTYTFRPLPIWPHPPTKDRKPTPFRAGFKDTLAALEYEITRLRGSNVIIGIGLADADLRNDGMPRKNAGRPNHPGVELSFDTPDHGRLVYACDAFVARYYGSEDWHANLRAVALGLEHLRTLDRYGIGRRGQQYAGYAALPPGIALGDGLPTTQTQARQVIADVLGNGHAINESSIRDALRKAHPDTGGDPETFRRVDAARRLLAVGA